MSHIKVLSTNIYKYTRIKFGYTERKIRLRENNLDKNIARI